MGAVTEARQPLSRAGILRAALDYVDKHGLGALSMHKLGAELGVKAMSLYNHIDGKNGLLDGLVEAMWSEVDIPDGTPRTWQQDVSTFAQSLRDMVRRHPEAAQLLMSRRIMPTQALEIFETYVRRLQDSGHTQSRAVELVRTVTSYAFGFALFELTWMETTQAPAEPDDGLRSFRHVSNIVPSDTPEHLVRMAMVLCTGCDMDAQFNFGIDLMTRALETEDAPGSATG